MMINGFTPRMSFLSSPSITQRSAAPSGNPMPALGLNPNSSLNSSLSSLPGVGLPSWNASSLFSPFSNAMSSVSSFGSRLFGGLSNSLSGLGQMTPLSMPGMPALNTSFTQPPISVPAMPSLQAPRPSVFQSLSNGAGQALKDVGAVLQKNAPAALAFGGAMMGGGAVCAFMGGAMAATGGIMMGNQMMQPPTNHPA
jgi:hypothetical protein